MVSISSLTSCAGGSLLQVRTLKASVRLAVPAGDPNDMGLPEYELCSDLLRPWLSPGGVVHVIGDPSTKFRSSFSQSVMGDILGRMPTRAKSKDGIMAGALL